MKKILFDILYYSQILRFFPTFYFHYELRKYIKKGDVVIDIGANWGIYTRLFSRWVGKDGYVYAVEPLSQFWEELDRVDNTWVYPYALGDESRTIYMEHWRDTDGAYMVVKHKTGLIAQMVNASLPFGELSKINFIKIDVESFTEDEGELPIIKDMQKLIKKHKPMILVETGFIDKILEILDYKIKDKCLDDYLIEAKTKNS